jgi:hypothetical protein
MVTPLCLIQLFNRGNIGVFDAYLPEFLEFAQITQPTSLRLLCAFAQPKLG